MAAKRRPADESTASFDGPPTKPFHAPMRGAKKRRQEQAQQQHLGEEQEQQHTAAATAAFGLQPSAADLKLKAES